MRHSFAFALALLFAGTAAFAQEPVGCDSFKWSVDRERALLASATPIAIGAAVARPIDTALKLTLVPFGEANLPMEPSRKPSSDMSYAGYVGFVAPPGPATYRVTLSDAAWIDVIQNGRTMKSGAFSGVTGCEGIRKSVKFDLAAAPFVIEVSGASTKAISVVLAKD
jgi:hypothetical protein